MNFKPTPEQKEAIEAGDGPVLIIAGAGTGKTFTVTQRILHLIKEKDVDPKKILALTFTEKAAAEMVERVDRELPLGYPELDITTFHSFCDQFLREEAFNVGLSPEYNIMTTSDEIFFLRKHLFDFDLKLLRPKGNPTKFVAELVKHISRLQDENISIEKYEEYYEKSIKNDDSLSEDQIAKTREIINFIKKYEELKAKNDRLSFGDLISKTYNILIDRDDIRDVWQNKYDYILIDEFQDTNYSQYELAKKLLKLDNPNIMVVADDDQSIYKFRGAAVSNVLKFTKDFPETKRFLLTQNRRSVQEILDKSYKLIQNNNPDRLEPKEGISKELTSMVEPLGLFDNPIKFESYLKSEDEAEGIALRIKEIIEKGRKQLKKGDQLGMEIDPQEDIFYKDIAILSRAHTHVEDIVPALRRHGIPYQFSGARKLFNQDVVKDLISFLRVLVDYTDDISMNGVLDFEIWGFEDREIVEINVLARRMKKSIFEVLESVDIETKYDQEKIKLFMELVEKYWGQMRDKQSTWQILYDFVESSGYIANLSEDEVPYSGDEAVRDVSEEFEKRNKIKNISKLFDFIATFEKNNPDSTVYEFIDYVDLLLGSGDSPLIDSTDVEDRDAVHVMTIHASKGLEFPVVFLPSVVRGRFPSRNRSDVLPIPDELIDEVLPEGDEHEQEERRLMYVAVTRAKYKMILTAANYYGTGKRKKKVSQFAVEMFGEEYLQAKINNPIELEPNIIQFKDMNKGIVPDNKIKYLSYSQISDYITCPRKYKYRYILKVPTRPSAALSYGNSIHNTLKVFFEIIKRNRESMFSEDVDLETLLEILDDKWIKAGYLDVEHERQSFERARNSLKEFYEEYKSSFKDITPVFVEQGFNLNLDGVRLRGKIDRLDIKEEGGEEYREIIDYKTGDRERSQNEINRDKQLVIYALAAEKVFGISVDKLSLLFVDQGRKMTADNAKIEKLKEDVVAEIVETASKIESGDFTAKPGFHCKFCDFRFICKYAEL